MARPEHSHPCGEDLEGREDLAHDLSEPRGGESVVWTRSMPIEDCILCRAGICTQRIDTETGHVLHGLVVN